MLIVQFAVAIVVAYLAIQYIKRWRARQERLETAYVDGADMGRKMAHAVEAYLQTRFRQFEETFIPIYQQRLVALGPGDIDHRRMAAQSELRAFAQELDSSTGGLVDEVQRVFKEPFEAAELIGTRDTLVQLAADIVSRESEETLARAIALAADAVEGY